MAAYSARARDNAARFAALVWIVPAFQVALSAQPPLVHEPATGPHAAGFAALPQTGSDIATINVPSPQHLKDQAVQG